MKELYQVEGFLNEGFIGQISYTICLEQPYSELDIVFEFDQQHYSNITEEIRTNTADLLKKEYGIEPSTERLDHIIKNDMKTEIHTLAQLNDSFIGCVHRQETCRHMYFSATEATNGCIPQEDISGVLKVTLLVFNVLLDHTHYRLSVRAC